MCMGCVISVCVRECAVRVCMCVMSVCMVCALGVCVCASYQRVQSLLPVVVFPSGPGGHQARKYTEVYRHWSFSFSKCVSCV